MRFDTYIKVYISMCAELGIRSEKTKKELYALYIKYQKREGQKMPNGAKTKGAEKLGVKPKKIRTIGAWIAYNILRPLWLYVYGLERRILR